MAKRGAACTDRQELGCLPSDAKPWLVCHGSRAFDARQRSRQQRDAGVHNSDHAGPRAQHTSHGCDDDGEPTQGARLRLRLQRSSPATRALREPDPHAAAGAPARPRAGVLSSEPALGPRRRRVAGAINWTALPRQRRRAICVGEGAIRLIREAGVPGRRGDDRGPGRRRCLHPKASHSLRRR